MIVDVTTARPEVENFGIDATYTLIDLATKKVVVTGRTFARVSYDIPGQQQRFARPRGLRDAENRAAKVIADRSRRGSRRSSSPGLVDDFALTSPQLARRMSNPNSTR